MQLSPKFDDYFNQLIADFETENPDITVKWVDVPWGDMETKILAAVSAGNAPDVVNLNPNFASQLASKGAWLTLDDKLSPEDQAMYLPKIWEATQLNGESFGFPWYLTARITLYNTDIFKAAGITEPPATFEELAEVAKTVKEKTGKYAFFITFVPEDAADVLQSFVQMGVPLVDDAGQAAFNTPAGKAVFQYWTDLYQKRFAAPRSAHSRTCAGCPALSSGRDSNFDLRCRIVGYYRDKCAQRGSRDERHPPNYR